MKRLLVATALLFGQVSAAAPPAEEVVDWTQRALNQSGSAGFSFSETTWNAPTSFPIASAVVLYEQIYGPILGTALLSSAGSIPSTCPYDEVKLAGISESFYDYLESGEIKALLTDSAAVSAHLLMIEDAITSQQSFVATPSFSVSVSDGFLVTTGVQVASDTSQSGGNIVPEPLNWDEATAIAAEQIQLGGLDQQFHPITALDGGTFTNNVDELRARLSGFSYLRIEPIVAVWGLNGSRIFTKVSKDSKYLVVDGAVGVAYGPYEEDATGATFVGDALSQYGVGAQDSFAVLAVLTPCRGNPKLNPATVPKPATWPAMPAWPVPPAAPTWTCESTAPANPSAACRCQVKRTFPKCKCGFFGFFCSDCSEYVECIFDPGVDPGMPSTCGGPGMPNPPAPGTFCNEYWGYE